jgi:FkbH-like protein
MVDAQIHEDMPRPGWYVAPYGQYAQEILDPGSGLYAACPDLVFIVVAAEDLFGGIPSAWIDLHAGSSEGEARIEEFASLLVHAAEALPRARICVCSLLPLEPEPHRLLWHAYPHTLTNLALAANERMAGLAAGVDNFLLLDFPSVVSEIGRRAAFDARYYYTGRMRLSHAGAKALAGLFARVVVASLGARRKCIVVDLDNTLWGGVLGEDGPDGLALGEDGIGRAFRDVQRLLLDLYSTGIALAICSRNDEAEALEVLATHPGMLLRAEHFAATRINWQDKATNIRDIADELNLGLGSFVFLDDSAFERDLIRDALPEVAVLDIADDPADVPAILAASPLFDALTLTAEDHRRSAMYGEERTRRQLRREVASIEDYLHRLAIHVVVRRANQASVPRLAQLSERTNQFNLTTRRYSEGDLLERLSGPAWMLFEVESWDRAGPTGVVGGCFVERDSRSATARVDTFLLSCRVLGRGIETAFLCGVLSQVDDNLATVTAEFIPSKRNSVAQDFLPSVGFRQQGDHWVLDVAHHTPLCPAWISLDVASTS